MANEHTDPDFLAELDHEADFLKSRQRRGGSSQRIDLKEVGDAVVARLVPYKFDDKGRWYARVARHWVNNRPYVCTRDTAEEHGGTGHCKICTLLDKMNGDRNKDVSGRAYKMFSVMQYVTQSILFEQHDIGRSKIKFKGADLLKAHELWTYKDPFQELMSIFKSYLRRCKSPLSILDPIEGCDLYISKTRRGLRFDREDPFSLASKPEDAEAMLEKVLDSINFKTDKPTEGDDLEDLLIKIEDQCLGVAPKGDDRNSSRRGGDDRGSRNSRDIDEDAPRGSRGESDSRRSSRDEPESDRRSSRDEPASDRRSSRDEPERRTSSRDEPVRDARRDAPDERRSSRNDEPERRTSRDEPVSDRRSSREEPSSDRRAPRDEPASDRRSSRDEPASDRRSRDEEPPARRSEPDDRRSRRDDPPPARREAPASDRHPDLEEGTRRTVDQDEDENARGSREDTRDDDPPPPVGRGASGSRREITPPPAAVTGAGSKGKPDDEHEDDPLPDDDKDKAPATPPAATDIAPAPAKTTTAAAASSGLSAGIRNSIRNRVSKADNDSTR